jgi:Protein kinase domain
MQQCNPQLERDILLRALHTDSVWAPHLLCAFQTTTHLNLVMDYIEGGTLWDVLESTPLERIREVDLRWWLPQVISAIAWCHSQGFVHRHVSHPSYPLLVIILMYNEGTSNRTTLYLIVLHMSGSSTLALLHHSFPAHVLFPQSTAAFLVERVIIYRPKFFRLMSRLLLPWRCLMTRLTKGR